MDVVDHKVHFKIKVVLQPCERVTCFNADGAFVSSHMRDIIYADVITHKVMEICLITEIR